MFVKNIILSNNPRKLWYIIIGALAIAISLIALICYKLNMASPNGFNISNIIKKDGIMKLKSYYANYSLTIKSNKNTNNYVIDEWYQKNDNNEQKYKFQFKNELGDTITYSIDKDILSLKSENEKSEFSLSNYVPKNENLFSLATFIHIYSDIIGNEVETKSCIKQEEIDTKTSYKIIFDMLDEQKYINKVVVSAIELILDTTTGMPTELFVYDKDSNVYINVSYNKFEFEVNF